VHKKVHDRSFGAPQPLPFMVDDVGNLVLCEATAFVFFSAATVTGIVSPDFHITTVVPVADIVIIKELNKPPC